MAKKTSKPKPEVKEVVTETVEEPITEVNEVANEPEVEMANEPEVEMANEPEVEMANEPELETVEKQITEEKEGTEDIEVEGEEDNTESDSEGEEDDLESDADPDSEGEEDDLESDADPDAEGEEDDLESDADPDAEGEQGLEDEEPELESEDAQEGSEEDGDEAESEGETQQDPTKKYGNLDEDSIKMNKIEAALFVAARPISVEEIMTKTDLKKKEIGEFIQKLALIYQARATALEIVRVGEDKFSLQIKPQYTEDVKKFASGGLLSEAVMRTLTIIAAKQPIPKAIVVKLRGGGAYQHIKELLQNELIVEQKKGRSSELMTTERFADMFGLSRDINELKKALIKSLGIKNE